MSATTPADPRADAHAPAPRKGLAHHATRPHGIILIGGFIFLIAWCFWTFFLASPATVP
ncbi:MAG: hypothetical protein H7318_00760 [Oligoflexus sp.]|nr:hypothetical protein [Oligoflexus sp.]